MPTRMHMRKRTPNISDSRRRKEERAETTRSGPAREDRLDGPDESEAGRDAEPDQTAEHLSGSS